MATPDIKAQIAPIPNTKCQLCEEYNVSWKCFNCDEYLCHHCKKIHLKSKFSRDHRVTTIKCSDKQEQLNEEKQDTNCSFHPKEHLLLFCKECDLQICTDCVVGGSHKHHTFLKTKDIIEEKQRELSSIIDESDQKLSEFEQNIKIIQKIRTDYSRDVDKSIDAVKERNALLKSILDQITDEDIAKLQRVETQNQEELKKKEKLTENELSELTEIIIKCKEKQNKRETLAETIQFIRDVKYRLTQFKTRDPPDPLQPPVFLSRNVDVEEIEDLFGDLDFNEDKGSDYERSETVPSINTNPTIDVKVISTFSMQKIDILAAVNDTHAWLGLRGLEKRKLILVTSDGKVIQTVNKGDLGVYGNVYDMAVTNLDELLITGSPGKKVEKLTYGGRFVNIYVSPDRCETRGITVTDTNDIIVCVYDTGTKEGKLVQLSPEGQQITTIQYDRDGETPFFNDPWRVSSNRNGDLIVVNRSDKEVVVVDKTGNRKFTYIGQVEGLKKSFNPYYTVTDQYGHIIISDTDNSVLHLLDIEGNFLRLLLTNKYGIKDPRGMCIDKSGRLWVCNYVGTDGLTLDSKVMVVKYV